jgi:hypothetical protein
MLIDPSARVDLFHTPTGTAFADLVINGHRETWPIRSVRFRAWLRRHYYETTGNAPSADCVNSTLNLLETRAQFDGPERAVHVRVAEQDGHIFVDLADEHVRAIEMRAAAVSPCAKLYTDQDEMLCSRCRRTAAVGAGTRGLRRHRQRLRNFVSQGRRKPRSGQCVRHCRLLCP